MTPRRRKINAMPDLKPEQASVLACLLAAHLQFHNIALEERISAWRDCQHSDS